MITRIKKGDKLRVGIHGTFPDVIVIKTKGEYSFNEADFTPIDILVELSNEERLWIKSFQVIRNLTEEQYG